MIFRVKLFGARIDPACEYCRHGQASQDGQMILCRNKGIVAPYYSCRKFFYCPLKRIPKPRPKLLEFSPEDFEL